MELFEGSIASEISQSSSFAPEVGDKLFKCTSIFESGNNRVSFSEVNVHSLSLSPEYGKCSCNYQPHQISMLSLPEMDVVFFFSTLRSINHEDARHSFANLAICCPFFVWILN
jgi:hypothetical protein